nr:MAG TPA: TFIIB zinc-binding [Caudoviricetes sp.]
MNNKLNLKELIDNNAEEIAVKGSYNDVHCAFSIYDKQNKYEFAKILSDNSFLFKLKQNDAVMKYKLPKDYKKPDKFKQVEFDQFNHELYNSPITLVQSAIETQIEDGVLKAVQEIGFDIDPEQLYKALQYDRNQYDKGYSDAKRQYDRGHAHWEEFNGKTELCLICSKCSHNYIEADPCCTERFNYCPNCGAQMDEEVEE